jgi:hypothetical protein
MSTARISLADLIATTASVLVEAKAAFQDEQHRTTLDIASAIREKSGLADGYWKHAHVARLRYQSALALNEALADISSEKKPGGLGYE